MNGALHSFECKLCAEAERARRLREDEEAHAAELQVQRKVSQDVAAKLTSGIDQYEAHEDYPWMAYVLTKATSTSGVPLLPGGQREVFDAKYTAAPWTFQDIWAQHGPCFQIMRVGHCE
jgi:hypothetical protein